MQTAADVAGKVGTYTKKNRQGYGFNADFLKKQDSFVLHAIKQIYRFDSKQKRFFNRLRRLNWTNSVAGTSGNRPDHL
jgi:hypothetical protein